MPEIPQSLESAVAQARDATRAALEAGVPRLVVELVEPELKVLPVAEQFYPVLQQMGLSFRLFFPDAGAAALARRDWQNPDFSIRGVGEQVDPFDPEDEALVFVEPSAVEVNRVEEICDQAIGRSVIMLNPQLEEVATIGIGYAGRQLRERFLSTLETVYYIRVVEDAVLYRCYPQPWQVWRLVGEGDYELLAETPSRPSGEALDRILFGGDEGAEDAGAARPRRSFLAELQGFLRALTQ